jgi:hypothetical protein
LVSKTENEGGFQITLPTKLSTIVSKIKLLPNEENSKLVLIFHDERNGQ